MVRGHSWPSSSDRLLEFAARRDGAKAKGKSQRCLKCQFSESVGVKVLRKHVRQREDGPQSSQSGRSAGGCFQQDHQVAALAALGENDESERSALEAALKKVQVQAVVPPVAEQIEQTQKFIERVKKRVVIAEEYVSGHKIGRLSARRSCRRQKNVCRDGTLSSSGPRPQFPDRATELLRPQQLAQAQAPFHQVAHL